MAQNNKNKENIMARESFSELKTNVSNITMRKPLKMVNQIDRNIQRGAESVIVKKQSSVLPSDCNPRNQCIPTWTVTATSENASNSTINNFNVSEVKDNDLCTLTRKPLETKNRTFLITQGGAENATKEDVSDQALKSTSESKSSKGIRIVSFTKLEGKKMVDQNRFFPPFPTDSFLKKKSDFRTQSKSAKQQHHATSNTSCLIPLSEESNVEYYTPYDQMQSIDQPENIKKIHEKSCDINKLSVTPAQLRYALEYNDEFMGYLEEKDLIYRRQYSHQKIGIMSIQWQQIYEYILKIEAFLEYPPLYTYETMKIFFAYMCGNNVPLSNCQATILASMWIILKTNLPHADIPTVKEIIRFWQNAKDSDIKMFFTAEKSILCKLNFDLPRADIGSIISNFLINEAVGRNSKLYYLTSYMVDVSLFDEKMCVESIFRLAGVCLQITLLLTLDSSELPRNMEIISNYFNISDGDSTVRALRERIMRMVELSLIKQNVLNCVFKKYSQERYGKVALLVTEKFKPLLKKLRG